MQGGERHTYYFLNALSRYAQITCFTVEENKTWDNNAIKINPLLGSSQNKFRYINASLISKIKQYCKSEGITNVMIEHPYYGWLGYMLKKKAGVKFIIHSHNIESFRFKTLGKSWWKLLYHYEKFAHQKADVNFFITEEDKEIAIKEFHLQPGKCFISTYGINTLTAPSVEKVAAKQQVCKELGLDVQNRLLLFNGALNYGPNRTAAEHIVIKINPLLQQKMRQPYKIIICGKADDELKALLTAANNEEIVYAGFVPDIQQYFLAADIFINPVVEGGGIKTKLVEALGANTPAVSFQSGAFGIPELAVGDSLTVIADNNFEGFANAVMEKMKRPQENVPPSFYEHFNWDKIARRALQNITTASL